MLKNKMLYRGLSMVFGSLLVLSISAMTLLERYRQPLDENIHTESSRVVVDSEDGEWTYESDYRSAKEAVEGMRDFAIRESIESYVLLKNGEISASNTERSLPLDDGANVTLFGMRSYAPVYGSKGGSIPDINIISDGNTLVESFEKSGLNLNPQMVQAYENFFADMEFGGFGYGAIPPDYAGITDDFKDPHEIPLSELETLNPDYDTAYNDYNDAAIVIFGRPGGEGQNAVPGAAGLGEGVTTTTGNILSLTAEEKEILNEAKENFENVIVLINSVTQMDIAELENDPDVDSVLWIGGPGAYGFYGVAQVLQGQANPSGHLGDIYASNNAVNPAMQNFGDIPWGNLASIGDAEAQNVNGYLIEAEGIYTGYRYYETRYADVVTKDGDDNAQVASAGTYVDENGIEQTVEGTWNYSNEVVYPFGYGLSYTDFSQTLDSVEFTNGNKTALVTVTVKNEGEVAGKDAVEVYAQSPYTEYDRTNGVEKAAVQLLDFEKTRELAPQESQTITLTVDMANLASYDANRAGTYIMDISDDYYFAIGSNSHDALNNILAARGFDTADGMDYNGDSAKAYKFSWNQNGNNEGVDTTTFAVSKNGTPITNKLSEGDYAMDFNAFQENTVTYLTRADWDGTYPESYTGLNISENMKDLMLNDFIPLASGETSEVKFGVDHGISFSDMKGVEFDDPKWDEFIEQIPADEILNFMANAFHNIEGIPSIDFDGYAADDGPGGADSNSFSATTGGYRGQVFEDSADYEGYGTRIAPAPINLAYTWNKDLAYENGEQLLGETTLLFNLPIVIGPAMNIHRHAYNGRGVEYYSEDPILSGFIGSAAVQGAQSKGCLVNIKHAAFNDQEIHRSGVAVFMNEQKARELELRNLQQAFEGNGRPASFEVPEGIVDNSYGTQGALGVMTAYNRIGAVASSANHAVQVDILRGEWGFIGYSVTDFTGVTDKAAPKESILAGTTAFCGMGAPSVSYWSVEALTGDKEMCQALHDSMHYALYALSNSYAMDLSINTHVIWLMTWWRAAYISAITVSSILLAGSIGGYIFFSFRKKREED